MSLKRRVSDVDAGKVRDHAEELGHLIGDKASDAGTRAAKLAHEGKTWVTDVAAPKVDKAVREGVKVAAPKVEAAAEKVRPAIDTAHDKLVDDYIPRLQKAMQDAAKAASKEDGLTAKASAAGKATQDALSKPPRSRRALKTVGWVLVGTVAAGTGYLLWRRTQPVDDPWAEEYWEGVDDNQQSVVDKAKAVAASATESVKSAASDAVENIKDAAGKLGDAAEAKAEDVSEDLAAASDNASDALDEAGKALADAADGATPDDEKN